MSAYRDKLERGSKSANLHTDWYYKTYGHVAVQLYRKKAEAKFGQEFFSPRNHFGSPLPDPKEGTLASRTKHHPIFWEFAKLIISQDPTKYDNHWKPVCLLCSHCDIDYRYIFHFENLSQESTFIEKLLDPNGTHKATDVDWFNPTIGQNLNMDSVMEMYFNQLSDKEIFALYKIYEVDFMTFGYTYQRGNLSLPMK